MLIYFVLTKMDVPKLQPQIVGTADGKRKDFESVSIYKAQCEKKIKDQRLKVFGKI